MKALVSYYDQKIAPTSTSNFPVMTPNFAASSFSPHLVPKSSTLPPPQTSVSIPLPAQMSPASLPREITPRKDTLSNGQSPPHPCTTSESIPTANFDMTASASGSASFSSPQKTTVSETLDDVRSEAFDVPHLKID